MNNYDIIVWLQDETSGHEGNVVQISRITFGGIRTLSHEAHNYSHHETDIPEIKKIVIDCQNEMKWEAMWKILESLICTRG